MPSQKQFSYITLASYQKQDEVTASLVQLTKVFLWNKETS